MARLEFCGIGGKKLLSAGQSLTFPLLGQLGQFRYDLRGAIAGKFSTGLYLIAKDNFI
jgi:hypothetical protein